MSLRPARITIRPIKNGSGFNYSLVSVNRSDMPCLFMHQDVTLAILDQTGAQDADDWQSDDLFQDQKQEKQKCIFRFKKASWHHVMCVLWSGGRVFHSRYDVKIRYDGL